MIGHAAGIYAMHQRSGLGSVADRPVADEGHPSSCSADQIGMIRFIRQVVVVRGLASHVNCLKGCEEVPRHSRIRGARLPADDAHYEGTSTERIVAPTGPAWAGAGGSSPRSPWRSDRWTSMPHWRRCHDERQASLAGYRCHPRAVAGEGLLRADEMLDEALAHAFLDKLLGVEMDRRKERRIRTSLRLSSLPTGQTLENYAFQRTIERSRIETLAIGAWIRNSEAVSMFGPPGDGKSNICVALDIKAVQLGFSAQYFRFDALMSALKANAGPHEATELHVHGSPDDDRRDGIRPHDPGGGFLLLPPGRLPARLWRDDAHDQQRHPGRDRTARR